MGRFIKILKHPVTGILITVVISFGLFYASKKEVSPKYTISKTTLLAKVNSSTPRLQLLWDGKEIPNIHSVNVALWNHGRKFLDKKDISLTDPIKLVYPDNIEILFYKFSNTSRANLSFTTVLQNQSHEIVIEINGDEGLENGDGGVLNLLYSGPEDAQFSIKGRIKGVPNGFVEVMWDYFYKEKYQKSRFIFACVAFLIALYIGFGYIYAGIKQFYKNGTSFSNYFLVGFGLLIIIVCGLGLYGVINHLYFRPKWLI